MKIDSMKIRYIQIILIYIFVIFFAYSILLIPAKILFSEKISIVFWGDLISIAYSSYSNLLIYLVILFLVCSLGHRFFKDDYLVFKKNIFKSLIIIIFIILINYAFQFFGSIISNYLNISGESINQQEIKIMLKSFLLPTFITAVLCAPIVEEFIFRKCIFGLTKNIYLGIFFSAITFAFLHVVSGGDYWQIIPYLMSGLAYGITYAYFKQNIFYLIIAHMVNNLIAIIILISL